MTCFFSLFFLLLKFLSLFVTSFLAPPKDRFLEHPVSVCMLRKYFELKLENTTLFQCLFQLTSSFPTHSHFGSVDISREILIVS